MIKTWTVERFKSIYDRTELSMGPLTIFAGINNSGKSTVIQSILLAAQTIQIPLHERPVALNGHILRLGTFGDIVSTGQDVQSIRLGFKLGDLQNLATEPGQGSGRVRSWRRVVANIESLTCEFSFSSNDEGRPREVAQLQPDLDSCSLEAKLVTEKPPFSEKLAIARRRESVDEYAARLQLKDPSPLADRALAYEVTTAPTTEAPEPRFLARGSIVGAWVSHFVPRALLIRYDAVEERVRHILRAFTSGQETWAGDVDPDDLDELPPEFRQVVLEVCDKVAEKADRGWLLRSLVEERLKELNTNFSAENYRRFLTALSGESRTFAYQLIADRQERLQLIARQDRPAEYRTRYKGLPEPLEFASDYIISFFRDDVKYLAPLRDEPKPIYPLSGSTDLNDVGFRGEHTAAVLELNRTREVEYIASSDLVQSIELRQVSEARLYDAVLDWLEYLGVVSDVVTIDRGKLGHELKVATDDSKALRDLTHVGVGVSQVLPIVVAALLADRGSTLIFEQPELHLHPRVQSRLADFFLSMALLGKQCIVETHSEHLITKLRQRVASSGRSELANSIVMYFVKARGGKSVYVPVEITPTGSIKNWPKGFFDEGEELAAEILRAAVSKRSKAREEK